MAGPGHRHDPDRFVEALGASDGAHLPLMEPAGLSSPEPEQHRPDRQTASTPASASVPESASGPTSGSGFGSAAASASASLPGSSSAPTSPYAAASASVPTSPYAAASTSVAASPSAASGSAAASLPGFGERGEPQPPRGFWRSLTSVERDAFVAAAMETVFPIGHVLWHEGGPADHLLVIRSGWLSVCVEREGRERLIAIRGPGDIIGERAALLLRQRSATVVALDTVHALHMTTQQFAEYLSDHPRVVAVLEREVYDRLTEDPGAAAQGPPSPPQQVQSSPPPYGTHSYTVGHPYGLVMPQQQQVASVPAYAGIPRYGSASPSVTTFGTPSATHATSPHGQTARSMAITSASGAGRTPAWAGQMCSILFTDIAGFSAPHRNDTDRLAVRSTMYELLHDALEISNVPWEACHREDRGDGALIVVPPEMPTASVIDPMIARLAARLRRHNGRSSQAVRIQLRVALHVGPVMPDMQGVSGWAIIHTARLLDAPVLKDRLATTGADLGFIASTFVYESVIAHGPGYVNAADYEPVTCQVKESELAGWMHLPGVPVPSPS